MVCASVAHDTGKTDDKGKKIYKYIRDCATTKRVSFSFADTCRKRQRYRHGKKAVKAKKSHDLLGNLVVRPARDKRPAKVWHYIRCHCDVIPLIVSPISPV